MCEMRKEAAMILEAAASVETELVFSDANTNWICAFDISLQKIRLITQVTSENPLKRDLYNCSIVRGKVVCFVPRNASSLVFFDTKTNKYVEYFLPEEIKSVDGKFRCAVWVNDKIYLFGHNLNGIWIFKTKEKVYEKIFVDKEGCALYFEACYSDSTYIYATTITRDELWIIDGTTNQIETQKFSDVASGYVDIIRENQHIILLPYSGEYFVRYNLDLREWEKFELGIDVKQWSLGGGIMIDSCLWIFMRPFDPLVIFDFKKKSREYVNLPELDSVNGSENMLFSHPICNGNFVMVHVQTSNVLVIIDKERKLFSQIRTLLQEEDRIKFEIDVRNVGVLKEFSLVNLEYFLNAIVRGD